MASRQYYSTRKCAAAFPGKSPATAYRHVLECAWLPHFVVGLCGVLLVYLLTEDIRTVG